MPLLSQQGLKKIDGSVLTVFLNLKNALSSSCILLEACLSYQQNLPCIATSIKTIYSLAHQAIIDN